MAEDLERICHVIQELKEFELKFSIPFVVYHH